MSSSPENENEEKVIQIVDGKEEEVLQEGSSSSSSSNSCESEKSSDCKNPANSSEIKESEIEIKTNQEKVSTNEDDKDKEEKDAENDKIIKNEEDDENEDEDGEDLKEKLKRFEKQVNDLKHLSSLQKTLLGLREKEVEDLREQTQVFENVVSDEKKTRRALIVRVESAEEATRELTQKLGQNVKTIGEMRANYESKMLSLSINLDKSEENFQKRTDELNHSELKNIELSHRVGELGELLAENQKMISTLEKKFDCQVSKNRTLSYQMSLLNSLFNESEGSVLDFQRIKAIGDIVRETTNLHLKDEEELHFRSNRNRIPSEESRKNSEELSAAIAENLKKDLNISEIPGEESCYKTIEADGSSKKVLSVSRTFIKLKDLILEKKSLQREIDNLKQLNGQLETKVGRQERRLHGVITELNKTWCLVAKLKSQHDQLHNSEAVLRYELQEKRKQLTKLKSELTQSREKWVKIRAKNSQSEREWESIRDEFRRRKQEYSQESAFESADETSSALETTTASASTTSTEDEQGIEVEVECKGNCAFGPCGEGEETENSSSAGDALMERPESPDEEVDPISDLVDDRLLTHEEEEEVFLEVGVVDVEAEAEADADVEDEEEGSGGDGDSSVADNPEELESEIRSHRLRLLEEQSRLLYQKLMDNKNRNSNIASRLATIHNRQVLRNSSGASSSQSPEPQNNPSSSGEQEPEPSTSAACSSSNSFNSRMNSEEGSSSPKTKDSDVAEEGGGGGGNKGRDSPAERLNELGRLIIKQFPKRIELLKKENENLQNEAYQSKAQMLANEELLRESVDKQKILSEDLEIQVMEKERLEFELKEEITEKENSILELELELDRMCRQKEKISDYFKLLLSEKADLSGPSDDRKSTKSCYKCHTKFLFFWRKKQRCSICAHIFCSQCTRPSVLTDLRVKKSPCLCNHCDTRRKRLSELSEENFSIL